MAALLEIINLHIYYQTPAGPVQAVRGVSLSLEAGETLAIVGESGCGKSTLAHAVPGLLPPSASVAGGKILWEERDITRYTGKEFRTLRGRDIGMVFQDPMTSLNPVLTIGTQLEEVFRLHEGAGRKEARKKAEEMLRLVEMNMPDKRLGQYPHELSGGMRQRVMLAMALASRPKLLIADEPTTALDVTVRSQILALLDRLQQEMGLAILLISHDLGVVAGLAQRALVMYGGKIVEAAPAPALFARPQHPYTEGLLRSLPRPGAPLSGIPGQPPGLINPPAGCPFHARCPQAMGVCGEMMPDMRPAGAAEAAAEAGAGAGAGEAAGMAPGPKAPAARDAAHRAACWRLRPAGGSRGVEGGGRR